jgi:hypothetical protein
MIPEICHDLSPLPEGFNCRISLQAAARRFPARPPYISFITIAGS